MTMDISSGAPNGLDPNAPPAGLIKDGTDQTFMQDVIEASKDSVVLVDFWAPWCGPCRQLTPTLEKVVNQSQGAVRLVKVNIDENQGVASQLQVRSVPTVFAFKDGQPVDVFQGALPESQIVEFIKKLGGGSAIEQIEAALAEAAQSFQAGELDRAAQIYTEIIRVMPDNVEAIAGLARCQLANDQFDQARQTLEHVPEASKNDPQVKSVLTALELAGDSSSPDETSELSAKVDATPDDFDSRFELAKALSGKGDHELAADHLLKILEEDLDWKDGAAKAQLLKIFEAAGPASDVTKSGRRKLSSLLFN